MSSTLFNRGMNTQVGMRRRAEEVKKSLDELRATAAESKAVQAALDTVVRENVALRALVTSLEARLSALEAKPEPTFDSSALDARISTLTTDLQAHVEKMAAIPDRVASVESRVTGLENRTTE